MVSQRSRRTPAALPPGTGRGPPARTTPSETRARLIIRAKGPLGRARRVWRAVGGSRRAVRQVPLELCWNVDFQRQEGGAECLSLGIRAQGNRATASECMMQQEI